MPHSNGSKTFPRPKLESTTLVALSKSVGWSLRRLRVCSKLLRRCSRSFNLPSASRSASGLRSLAGEPELEDQEPRLHEPGPAFSRLHLFLRLEQDSLFLCAPLSHMQSTSSLRRYPASSVGDLRPPWIVSPLSVSACSILWWP